MFCDSALAPETKDLSRLAFKVKVKFILVDSGLLIIVDYYGSQWSTEK